ncbi:hypothetical protein [Synechococcus sp. HIMB2401]|uniref:hypothetical protein n=1 Tax=Synechococcus sp. HIMB2401 TaxID=3144208 RepID=UPI0036F31035
MSERYTEALDVLLEPHVFQACDSLWVYHNLVGMSARQIDGQKDRAASAFERSIALDPNRPDTLYNFANLLKDDEPERAINLYRRSLAIEPTASSAWHNYGSTLTNLSHYHDALNSLRTSICLDPLVADVWCNLGLAYFGLEDFSCAERAFRYAISLDAKHAPSHTNLGNALISVLQPEEALRHLEMGVELDQSSTHSLWNLALAYLLLGNYLKGWEYYEVRFENEDFAQVKIPTSGPRVRDLVDVPSSNDLPLVVWSEQGLGDAIQFSRYLQYFDAMGVPFLFLTRPSLVTLFRDWFNLGDRVMEIGSTDPEKDERSHVALMSLPHLFKTEIHTIPGVCPYFQSNKVVKEELTVTSPPGGISVGIVWASNPDNKPMYKNKSLPLHLLMPLFERLLDLDLIELHSLQFGDDAQQISPWSDRPDVYEWKDKLQDFSDTAVILNQLDLVVSVDTAVAHLSGALNKPTWLLLPHNADFRWMRQRSDSPWYPSMRLFRQEIHGDWLSVADQLAEEFDKLLLLDTKALTSARMS